jgi:hypothetical protein
VNFRKVGLYFVGKEYEALVGVFGQWVRKIVQEGRLTLECFIEMFIIVGDKKVSFYQNDLWQGRCCSVLTKSEFKPG